ncbi:MAG: hypothetical protein AABW53_02960 [Nanoarchaeota archaeon]
MLGTSILGCEADQPEEKKILYIPAECKEILSLSREDNGWNLTCKNEKDEEIFGSVNI